MNKVICIKLQCKEQFLIKYIKNSHQEKIIVYSYHFPIKTILIIFPINIPDYFLTFETTSIDFCQMQKYSKGDYPKAY
ncbi:hypothetical protein pb186bvf_008154 [Paramecium bursaria]